MSERSDPPLVVITGVAGGIGAAAARAFVEAGWTVAGLGHTATPPPDVDPYASIDLAGPEVEGRLEAFLEALPRIDALVNNAALQIVKPLRDTTTAEWDRMLAVNLRGAFLAIRLAQPKLQRSRGAVVNVASVHAEATSVGMAGYAASKGGLLALTRAAAVELGPDGIRVNALIPGAVDTPMLQAGATRFGDEGIRRIAARTPLGRVGQPDEVARAIVFLAGPDAAFVTGSTLTVDGGVLAALSSE
jgi:NAD(P)-dependent dehydrogenase (short-subunit alcohol dehydrogenase family)